jgi:pyruvate dehydrogenase (quinone)
VANERRKWDEMLDGQCDPPRSRDKVHPQAVARAVRDLAKTDATFVFDTGLNTLWSANWIRQNGSPHSLKPMACIPGQDASGHSSHW